MQAGRERALIISPAPAAGAATRQAAGRSGVRRASAASAASVPAGGPALRFLSWGAAAVLALFLALPLLAMLWRTAQESPALSPTALATLRQAMGVSLVTSSVAM